MVLQVPSILHVYQNNGLYTVSLEITDVNNCKDTLIRTDYIEVGVPILILE